MMVRLELEVPPQLKTAMMVVSLVMDIDRGARIASVEPVFEEAVTLAVNLNDIRLTIVQCEC